MSRTLAPGVSILHDYPDLTIAVLNGKLYERIGERTWRYLATGEETGVTLGMVLSLGLARERGEV